VDPNGPTLAALNRFDAPLGPALWTLSLRRVGMPGSLIDRRDPDEWFFLVSDLSSSASKAIYFLGNQDEWKTLRIPIVFGAIAVPFQSPRSFADLGTTVARYETFFLNADHLPFAKNAFSKLVLHYLSGAGNFDRTEVVYPDNIDPGPQQPGFPGLERGPTKAMLSRSGAFQFVR
jgi:hypothetical protein